MEYSKLLDLATDLGYELAMSGAETFRVEESITRILRIKYFIMFFLVNGVVFSFIFVLFSANSSDF